MLPAWHSRAASACAAEMGMDENAELLEAVVAGDVDRVKAALAKGADVNSVNTEVRACRA